MWYSGLPRDLQILGENAAFGLANHHQNGHAKPHPTLNVTPTDEKWRMR